MTAAELRSMLQSERREGISETQMDTARVDAMSDHNDTEMEASDDDINHRRIERLQSGNARTNKDVSRRQRSILQSLAFFLYNLQT